MRDQALSDCFNPTQSRLGRIDRSQALKRRRLATPSRFELPISSLTGRRVRPLHHGAVVRKVRSPEGLAASGPIIQSYRDGPDASISLRWRLIGSVVVAADALVPDFDFAFSGHHNRRYAITSGEPLDL